MGEIFINIPMAKKTFQSIIDKMIGLVRLPLPIQEGILDDTLALSMAVELGAMDAADAVEFTRLFQLLKLSLNKQREMLTLVKEISRREDIRIHFMSNFFKHLFDIYSAHKL